MQGFSAVKRFFHERRQEMLYQREQAKQVIPPSSSTSAVMPASSPKGIPSHSHSHSHDQSSTAGQLDSALLSSSGGRGQLTDNTHTTTAGVPPAELSSTPTSRSRAGSLEYGSEFIKSSQFKMIVVGHETAGTTIS